MQSAQIRAAWGTDPRTVLVFVDPTSPNILQVASLVLQHLVMDCLHMLHAPVKDTLSYHQIRPWRLGPM